MNDFFVTVNGPFQVSEWKRFYVHACEWKTCVVLGNRSHIRFLICTIHLYIDKIV